eukprot:1147744-Pelagomonas_calceolata.AAC.1
MVGAVQAIVLLPARHWRTFVACAATHSVTSPPPYSPPRARSLRTRSREVERERELDAERERDEEPEGERTPLLRGGGLKSPPPPPPPRLPPLRPGGQSRLCRGCSRRAGQAAASASSRSGGAVWGSKRMP